MVDRISFHAGCISCPQSTGLSSPRPRVPDESTKTRAGGKRNFGEATKIRAGVFLLNHPSEKYARQIGSLTQIWVNKENIWIATTWNTFEPRKKKRPETFHYQVLNGDPKQWLIIIHSRLMGTLAKACEIIPITSFFQVTLWSPKWRPLNHWKGHLTPQKGHSEEPGSWVVVHPLYDLINQWPFFQDASSGSSQGARHPKWILQWLLWCLFLGVWGIIWCGASLILIDGSDKVHTHHGFFL